jgi:hypothetical protein
LSQLTANQESLKLAEASLAALRNGSQDAAVKAASSRVTSARERLKTDQARLDQLLDGPTESEILRPSRRSSTPASNWLLLFLMGMFRPVVGAVIALVAVLAIQANLLRALITTAAATAAFTSVIAFFSGFSERFARDMLASTTIVARLGAKESVGAGSSASRFSPSAPMVCSAHFVSTADQRPPVAAPQVMRGR